MAASARLICLIRHASVFDVPWDLSIRASRKTFGSTNLLVQPDSARDGQFTISTRRLGVTSNGTGDRGFCGVTQSSRWEGYGQEVKRDHGEEAVRRLINLAYEHQKYMRDFD